MTDRLDGIAAFMAVAEAGGFAAAGIRLGLSRSAVAKTVARLEARLGARLFHRTTRSLALTDDGQMFHERCARGLAEIETGAAALETGRHEPVGRLRVALPVLFGRRCVAPVLYDLARAHPRLDLELSFSDRTVDIVEEGFDLAVRNGGLPDVAGLRSRRLAAQRIVVCAAPGYLARRGVPMTLEDLANHDTISYGRGGQVRRWLFPQANGGLRELPDHARIRCDDLEAMADAAASGMGVAWLPSWLVAARLAQGVLTRILADQAPMTFHTHALWPQGPHLPLRVRVAIDAMVARLPAMMGD